MGLIFNRIVSLFLSFLLILSGIIPELAGEEKEIPVECAVVIEERYLNNRLSLETISNMLIKSEAEWKMLAVLNENSDDLGFDSDFFANHSLAAHVTSKSGGMHTIKVTLAKQNRFTATIHFKQFNTSGVTTCDAPPVLILVPVAKTVVKSEFIDEGSETPGEPVAISAENVKVVNLESDFECTGYGEKVYYNYDKWIDAFGDKEDIINLGFNESYFEDGALAVFVVCNPSPSWNARVDWIIRKTFELNIFFTRVTEEEVHLDVLEYELVIIPVDKEVVTMNVRCIGEEHPGVQDFYTVPLNGNEIDQEFTPTVFSDYSSWKEAFGDYEEAADLGFDEAFFEMYSLAVTQTTLPASNYWIELYYFSKNDKKAKIRYYKVYDGEGIPEVREELFVVPVSKDITQVEFDCYGEIDKYEYFLAE